MSLRSRVRDLEGRRAHHLERLNRLARDVRELFRRSAADFNLHEQQTQVNRAVSDRFDAARAETLLGLRIVDTAIGALSARIEALEDAELYLSLLNDAELYPAEVEAALEVAIVGGLVVTFKYRDREGKSSYRVVSPYELRQIEQGDREPDPFLSLLAWDHGREAMRHFRVERIEGAVTATNVETYRPPHD